MIKPRRLVDFADPMVIIETWPGQTTNDGQRKIAVRYENFDVLLATVHDGQDQSAEDMAQRLDKQVAQAFYDCGATWRDQYGLALSPEFVDEISTVTAYNLYREPGSGNCGYARSYMIDGRSPLTDEQVVRVLKSAISVALGCAGLRPLQVYRLVHES